MSLYRISKMVANNIQKKPGYKLLSYLIVGMLVWGACARPATPTGGPKDEDPPVPLKSNPVNYSTNFNQDKIIILFDEFIVLKNVTQELLVSPPLEEDVEIKQRGKNLVIKINNELKDSTTYGINFYESIVDLNEGNLLKNFQFEFSTGDTFDSLYVAGKVRDAFNYNTEKGLYVMLYSELHDSLPRTTKPDYVSKTDEEGGFMITNMKNQPYYIFALKDLNNNMLFDLPNESVAFLDSTFSPTYHEVEFTDTLRIIDSISPNFKDTIFVDSIHRYKDLVTTIGNIQLFLFEEDNAQQYFIKEYRPEKQQVILSFNTPVTNSFSIKPLMDTAYREDWYIKENRESNDSLIFWLTDTAMFNNDSLVFEFSYEMKDSNNQNYIKTDTIPVFYKDEKENTGKSEGRRQRRFNLGNLVGGESEDNVEKDTIVKSELTFETNASTPFELNSDAEFVSRFPLKTILDSNVFLTTIIDDTVETNVPYKLIVDSLSHRKLSFIFEKDEQQPFKLLALPGAFTDIYDNINDTLLFEFSTRSLDHYGTLKVHLKDVKKNSIVQVLDTKEQNIIREIIVSTDTTLFYEHLQPKKYIVKLYYDDNNNGKWDTGRYKDLLQPEEVFYFPQEIDIKSNFDYEYTWELYPVPPSE